MRVEQYDILGEHEGKEPVPIPTGRVRFWLDEHTHVIVEPHKHHEGELCIYLAGRSRFGTLAVTPEAANVLRLAAVDSCDDLARRD